MVLIAVVCLFLCCLVFLAGVFTVFGLIAAFVSGCVYLYCGFTWFDAWWGASAWVLVACVVILVLVVGFTLACGGYVCLD